jgi:hypothetical protein
MEENDELTDEDRMEFSDDENRDNESTKNANDVDDNDDRLIREEEQKGVKNSDLAVG